MNVSCPQCSTTYRVDPAKVPHGGVRARCSSCGGVIPVGMSHDSGARMTPVRPATPVRPMTPVRPATPVRAATPVREAPPVREATPPRGAALPPLRQTPRTPWPSVATPSAPAPFVENSPPPPAAPMPRQATPQAARPFVPSQTPISVPAYTPPPPPPITPRPSTPPAPVASRVATPTAAEPVSSAPASTPPAPGERRPINPFLARDPSLRAKRLARALVSDMVAYYPAKHSEGLQKGTLKELFRDEIKKSYEEYVAQVGADFARTTNYFQEALNDVLGAGKRIF